MPDDRKLARASLIWGVLGVTVLPVFGGIAALVFGIKARKERQAVAGILLGAVSVLFAPLWLALLMPVFSEMRQETDRNACSDNIKQIYLAARLYRDQFHAPAPSARALVVAKLLQESNLRCPVGKGDDYTLVPIDPDRSPTDVLMIYEKDPSGHHREVPCGLSDGSVPVLWSGDIPMRATLAEQIARLQQGQPR